MRVRTGYLTRIALMVPWVLTRRWAIYPVADTLLAVGNQHETAPARAWPADANTLFIELPIQPSSWALAAKSLLPSVLATSFGRKVDLVVEGTRVEAHRIDRKLVLAENPHPPRDT